MEEDLDEVPAGHDELGHQVHVVVAVAPQSRGRLTGPFRAELGVEVGEVKGSTVPPRGRGRRGRGRDGGRVRRRKGGRMNEGMTKPRDDTRRVVAGRGETWKEERR